MSQTSKSTTPITGLSISHTVSDYRLSKPEIANNTSAISADKQCSPESYKQFASLIKNQKKNKTSPAKEVVSAFEASESFVAPTAQNTQTNSVISITSL